MSARFALLSLSLLTAGCATGQNAGGGYGPGTAAERGGDLAQRSCAGCHAVSLQGQSPRMNAPAFRDLRIRYNQASFQHRMAEIAEGGHYDMPALRLEASEVRDVAAYIESLESR